LAQRVSGWLITASAILILLSGFDWFKILPGWLLPFTYHIRFDLLLSFNIIIHGAIGLKFALLRRRIRSKKITPVREVSQARRESIIVLTGMFLSLIATIYLDVIPRVSIKIGEKLGLLPPGQYEVGKLQVLHVGPVPEFDDESWTLEVYGSVENPFILSHDEFKKLPRITSVSDFHCVTGWTKFSNKWEGVQFKTIIQRAKPHPESRFATIECERDYTTSLPLDELVKEDVILAYGLDDKDLAPEHGGPLRLVVPQNYGYKSAKWVRKIKFTEEQELGYWEIRGYSNTADPFTNDRYSR